MSAEGPADSSAPPPTESPKTPPRRSGAQPVEHGSAAWRRLGRALSPKLSKAQITAGLLCMLLGFAAVAQVRQVGKADFSELPQDRLVELLGRLDVQADQLIEENRELERERDRLASDQTNEAAAIEAAQKRAEVQGILAGTLPAEGPGIELTVTDPSGKLTGALAYTLVDELRNAGAEAISLGSIRITGSSYFLDPEDGQGVVVDGILADSPYVWRAIGQPSTLETALRMPGGVLAEIKAQGGSWTLQARDRLEIEAIKILPPPEYAAAVE
ncbi:MAG: DUF881 domain-containing protein [Bifidobacteriaceae bacterium]|jgi:uncharacterized protein YlxW (UPF0749 family)|nr:DUF881 domain-containing protein [Bifidobacteriaceae bacterium]